MYAITTTSYIALHLVEKISRIDIVMEVEITQEEIVFIFGSGNG